MSSLSLLNKPVFFGLKPVAALQTGWTQTGLEIGFKKIYEKQRLILCRWGFSLLGYLSKDLSD
jgi:hypothetical protein